MNTKIKILSLVLLGILFLIYCIFIETNWLEVTHHQIHLNLNPTKKIKIIQISDLHTKGLGFLERNVISKIQEEKPDIIFITGDIATPGGTVSGYNDILRELKAQTGVYFIPGNWEDWEPISDLQSLLQKNNIIDLSNKTVKLDSNLWMVGFADALTGSPDLSILNSIPKDDKILSFFHTPSFFKEVNQKVDFAFAGHTHGGQFRIPFLGAVILPPGSDHFEQGWFQQSRARMHVSRGLGTSILPMRFLSRPELGVFEIQY
jgi:predicted MPP superfamily phosphohydrolase